MSQPDHSQDRRRFLSIAVLAGAVAPLASTLMSGPARAADFPALDSNDATAKALGYVEDHTKVDAAKFPQHKPEQDCIACNFYGGGDTRGPCTLFAGKSVAAKGWCAGFLAKT